MKKVFLTVLYNQKYLESKTLCSFSELELGKNKDNSFVVWDNSLNKMAGTFELKQFLKSENVEYVHTPENIPLSKIYNACIDKYKGCDLCLIFDQDSKIIRKDFDSYLEKTVISNPEINIFLPQVYSNEKLYSPAKFFIFKGSHYKKLSAGVHKDCFYTAVMSGVCIRTSFLYKNNIRFNEELFLYGIDTCFFCDVRKIDPSFYVLDEKMNHDLSQNHLSDEERKVRARTYLEANFIMVKKSFIKTLIVRLYKLYLLVRGKI